MSSLQICVSLVFFYNAIPIEVFSFRHERDFLAVVGSDAFVDKTMLMQPIFEAGPRLLITAPIQFGKSTNLDMMKTFLSLNSSRNYVLRAKFKKLHIYKYNKPFFSQQYGKYPIVHLNFNGGIINSYQKAFNFYKNIVHKAYVDHKYLLYSRNVSEPYKRLCTKWCGEWSFKRMMKGDLISALVSLVRMVMNARNKKIVVLIDDYDSVINNALVTVHDHDEFKSVVRLTSQILSTLIQDTEDYVQLAVVTGISYITSLGLSEVKNLKRYYFLDDHPLVNLHGLTVSEIAPLYVKTTSTKKSLDTLLKNKLYTGYTSKRGSYVYNTYSIISFLKYGEKFIHWGINDYILSVIEMMINPKMAKIVDSLMRFKSVTLKMQYKIKLKHLVNLRMLYFHDNTSILPDTNLLLSHLLEVGLLTYTNLKDPGKSVGLDEVKIPNTGVHEIIFKHLKQYFSEKCHLPLFESEDYSHFVQELFVLYNTIKYRCAIIARSFIEALQS